MLRYTHLSYYPRVLLIAGLLLAGIALPLAHPVARAQGDPDAWTNIDLNLRAGPDGTASVLTILPPETPLVIEAHDAGLTWLLGHTLDGAWRGWVASGYLRYREGFAAVRLPVSAEIINAPPAAPAPQAAAPAENTTPADYTGSLPDFPVSIGVSSADGAIESLRLIYATDHSEYYELTYWSDGLRIKGFIGWPLGPGPHPAIIYNRGGAWDAGKLIGVEIIPLVECGYVAVASQYRGNGGSEGLETFGWDDIHDVTNLIPLLDSLPIVDSWRIGMMGGSRGGMMTYMALKNDTLSGNPRIRAAVTIGGLSDLFLWAEQSPDMVEDIYMAIIGATPEQRPDQYAHRSATHWPELINAPLMLLHGGGDWIVPVEQSQRLHDLLKANGKDVTLVIFEGDDHQLTGQLGGYSVAINFLNRYLSNDGADRNYESHTGAMGEVLHWFRTHYAPE